MGPRTAIGLGGLCAALSIGAGAFGAHGLAEALDARALGLWETAARYLMYAALGMIATGAIAWSLPRPGFGLAAWLQCVGAALFSGSLFALAFGGPAWLGAVTPAGGVGMILGFALLAWTAWRG
jgi:uncharacterized membrane protein YgdD (TMEM256/DUF423 family)